MGRDSRVSGSKQKVNKRFLIPEEQKLGRLFDGPTSSVKASKQLLRLGTDHSNCGKRGLLAVELL